MANSDAVCAWETGRTRGEETAIATAEQTRDRIPDIMRPQGHDGPTSARDDGGLEVMGHLGSPSPLDAFGERERQTKVAANGAFDRRFPWVDGRD